MSTHAKLKAEKRDDTGKGAARKLRASGMVPAVMYGKDADSLLLAVDANEAQHVFQAISVENTIVDVEIDGEDDAVPTLVREVQVHPVRPDLLHIDFYRIQADVAVEVDVPVNLNGMPEGVKSSGGVLEQIVHDLPVKCLPDAIPSTFEVDVTALDIGDSLHVSDLEIPEDVEVMLDLDRTICTVVIPRVIEEEEEEEEAEVEVIGEGEELPEGEEAPEGAEAEGEGETEDEES